MTIVEIMIVLAIIGTLAAIAMPAYQRYRQTALMTIVIVDLTTIEKDITIFQTSSGRLPESLAEIGRDDLLDPWHNPYFYGVMATMNRGEMRKDRFLVPLNSDYDLYSKGPDGKSRAPLTAKDSRDDILRANDGGYIGPAWKY